jgi:hypothetical protein
MHARTRASLIIIGLTSSRYSYSIHLLHNNLKMNIHQAYFNTTRCIPLLKECPCNTGCDTIGWIDHINTHSVFYYYSAGRVENSKNIYILPCIHPSICPFIHPCIHPSIFYYYNMQRIETIPHN